MFEMFPQNYIHIYLRHRQIMYILRRMLSDLYCNKSGIILLSIFIPNWDYDMSLQVISHITDIFSLHSNQFFFSFLIQIMSKLTRNNNKNDKCWIQGILLIWISDYFCILVTLVLQIFWTGIKKNKRPLMMVFFSPLYLE